MSDTRPPADGDTPADDAPDGGPTASGPTIPAELVSDGVPAEPLDDEADDDPFGLGNLLGGGGLDLGSLMEQASQMQAQMAEAQAAAAEQVVEGSSGGGVVKVTVTGAGRFQSVTIAPDAVDPDDVAMLEDLVLAALHDATDRVRELQEGAMGGALGGLGGLGDLLGG